MNVLDQRRDAPIEERQLLAEPVEVEALWHNALSVADAVGLPVDSMQVEVTIGVPRPDQVDKQAVLAVLPHGSGTVRVVEGGLEIPNDAGTNMTVIANAAAVVRLDIG